MRKTVAAAVALTEAEHARLTLVKTCAVGRAYVWVAPFAVGGAYLPPPVESPDEAGRMLARAAETVPDCIPVTMRVLACDTQAALLKLLRGGEFGAIVAEEALLSHCWRLRRQLRHDGVEIIKVTAGSGEGDAGSYPAHLTSSRVTEDGAPDAPQVTEGGGGRHTRLRPRFAGRLAGAGGEH